MSTERRTPSRIGTMMPRRSWSWYRAGEYFPGSGACATAIWNAMLRNTADVGPTLINPLARFGMEYLIGRYPPVVGGRLVEGNPSACAAVGTRRNRLVGSSDRAALLV